MLLTDNAGIQKLNKRYLKKDRPTDVLSFPMWDFNSELSGTGFQPVMTGKMPVPPGKGTSPFPANSELILGDIVISIETAKTQAKENGVTLDQEMARLLIHGILHLFGFDHEKSSKEAQRMKKEEKRLLKIAKCKL